MTDPTFLVIGAMKAGTSSLYHYLRQHPQIFMSPSKEPQYFAFANSPPDLRGPGDDKTARFLVTEANDYAALWRGAERFRARGEASTSYLYLPSAAPEIHRQLPSVRMIAVLRDPTERAHSNYLHMRRDAREPLADFSAALDAEPERIRRGWAHHFHYRTCGFYSAQLRRFFALFPREQIRIYLYEELSEDPAALLADLCSFLEVDPAFDFDTSLRHNVSGIPRSPWVHRILQTRFPRLRGFVPQGLRERAIPRLLQANLTHPVLAPAVEERLRSDYRDEVRSLADLIQRDLSNWLGG